MKNLGYLLGMALCGFFLKEIAFTKMNQENIGFAFPLVLFFFGFMFCFVALFQSGIKAIFAYLEKFTK
jgi:hypothetical protein